MNFWETFKQSPVNITKWWQFFRQPSVKQKQRYFIQIPAFNVSTPVWIGSSYITTEFRLGGVSNNFTLQPKYLTPPDNVNFCLAVRWPASNTDGLNVTRYKLWENVGERLYYPLYNGEILDKDCVFEIWSSADFTETSLVVPYNIYLSILVAANSYEMCCSSGSNQLNVVRQVCELFADQNINGNYDIPIVFNDCFDNIQPPEETFYRIIETDEIRATEDDLRVWR